MQNLMDLDRQSMVAFCQSLGEPSFRGQQLLKWIHQVGLRDFSQMHNLSKALRQRLMVCASIETLSVDQENVSSDGTHKWLLRLADGNRIETVFIPERSRGTLCVSSQVGCALQCSFCATGDQGFARNLSVAEIIGQVHVAFHHLKETLQLDRPITNVVMMGMGEPLLNYDAVLSAMDLMLDDFAYGLSKYRVTLSTSGIVPAIHKLSKESPVSLAVSLHAPSDALRDQLVPINRKYPLAQLMDVCKTYFATDSKRMITFEYVMLAGVNDQASHAKALVRCLQGVSAKINLIPFNAYQGARYLCSEPAVIDSFAQILMSAGLNVIVRRTRGDDIGAARGQLVGQFQDRTIRTAAGRAWQLSRQQQKRTVQVV
jgi:23S rRNA (adenine2503-C2)-methyltransferase